MMCRLIRWLVGFAGGVLLWVGIGGFLAGLVCTLFPVRAPHTEFPINDAQEIVVDRAGRVYVGVHFYDRVQQYAPDGTFLRGWPVAGRFALRVDDAGRVQVSAAGQVRTYDAEGAVVSTSPRDPGETWPDRTTSATAAGGDTYEIRGRLAFPRVVRTTPDGRASVVIAPRWYQWPIVFPIPGALFVPAAILLIQVSEWRRGRRQAEAAPAGFSRTPW